MNFLLRAVSKRDISTGPQVKKRVMLRYSTKRLLRPEAGKREAAEPLKKVASDLWTIQQGGLVDDLPKINEDSMLSHPLYTPTELPNTSIGPLFFPLKWPSLDQKIIPHHLTISNFDSNPQIGGYPTSIPQQWCNLKDPYSYWDQQGRRNYGDLIPDQDNFMDWLGIGTEVGWRKPLASLFRVFAAFGLLGTLVYHWDPQSRVLWTPREFPFNGLRTELGGDPNDESDDWMKAHSR